MVKCSKCGANNPANRKFCGDCGMPLGIVCSKCETANEPKQNFCGECGEKLERPELQKIKEKLVKTAKEASEPKPAEGAGGAPTSGKTKNTAQMALILGIIIVSIILIYLLCAAFQPRTIVHNQSNLTASAYCGDEICNSGENCGSCDDCACQSGYECEGGRCIIMASCGNRVCEAGETCSNCPYDCGTCGTASGGLCASDSDCSGGYCIYGVCRPTAPYCGDGYCDADETRLLCRWDCGEPLPNGSTCVRNGDCRSNYCANGVCLISSVYNEPSGYSVSWSPLDEPGFWQLFPEDSESSGTGVYAPGGQYGLDVIYINGAPVRYDYWRAYAAAHCLENVAGMSPQNIRAAAEDPALNCERFNVTEAPVFPKRECNATYSWCPSKGECIRIWEEPCYDVEQP